MAIAYVDGLYITVDDNITEFSTPTKQPAEQQTMSAIEQTETLAQLGLIIDDDGVCRAM